MMNVHELTEKFASEVENLPFSEDYYVYNPLKYAQSMHDRYLDMAASHQVDVVFLGMNPGPYGMMQCGVPFGAVDMVKGYLHLQGDVERPSSFHPRHPINGLYEKRQEVSGTRFWKMIEMCYPDEKDFFARASVLNYLPLCFIDKGATGRNITPDKLPKALRTSLFEISDRYLRDMLAILKPKYLVGVGAFAFSCLERVSRDDQSVISIPHPSPASPKSAKAWPYAVIRTLVENGVFPTACYEIDTNAKVNIGLAITGRRDDGYHNLDTYFHLVSLADHLRLEISHSDVLSIRIEGNESYLPPGAMDLMEKSARSFASASGRAFSLCIRIEKGIPVKAGLGGGSSDAAAILRILAFHYRYDGDLMGMGLALGSDIPFFLSGLAAAHATGRGEVLTPIKPVTYEALFCKKEGDEVSTAEAFAKMDASGRFGSPLPGWNPEVSYWKQWYGNDFSVIEPSCIRNEIESFGSGGFVSLSGSGAVWLIVSKSCIFSAEELEKIKKKGKNWNIVLGEFIAMSNFSMLN